MSVIVLGTIFTFTLSVLVFASDEIVTTDDPNTTCTILYQSDFSVDEDGWTGPAAGFAGFSDLSWCVGLQGAALC